MCAYTKLDLCQQKKGFHAKIPRNCWSQFENPVPLHRQTKGTASEPLPRQQKDDNTKGKKIKANRLVFYHIGFGKGIRFRLVKDCYLGVRSL